jgi:hypothetical protein
MAPRLGELPWADDPIHADTAAVIIKGGSECELVETAAELKRYLKENDLKDREKVKGVASALERDWPSNVR